MATAFSSDECNLLAQALEVAWDICRQSGDFGNANIDAAKAALTRSILVGYEVGERNPRRLAIGAVARLGKAMLQPSIIARHTPAA
jgi:hypothetical protein